MDVAKNVTLSFLYGLKDSFVGCLHAIKIVSQNSRIRGNVALCFVLNGVILAFSVVLFEQIVLPLVLLLIGWSASLLQNGLSSSQLEWVESVISYVFTGLWMLPMIVITTPINSLWIRDIAVEANKHVTRQSAHGSKKTSRWSVKMMITDLLYSIMVEVIFTLQATLVGFLPFCGWSFGMIHMSLLYSLYSFEYKWFYQGIVVQKRLSEVEVHWPYFLGFGFPLALVTSLPLFSPLSVGGSTLRHKAGNIVISACVFALSFPLMLLGSFGVTHSQISKVRISVFKLARMFCNTIFKFLLSTK